MAIPEPFRPTTLQREVAHPLIVDFMNWPSVRDQMILHMNDLDLDFLCRQIHLNAVIDVPSLKVSVKIQSVLDHLLISQGEKSSESYQRSYLQDPSWTFLRLLPGSPYFAMGIDPIDAFLENEISSRVLNHEPRSNSSEDHLESAFENLTKVSFVTSAECPITPQAKLGLNNIPPCLKLHQFDQWRISREFARRYPFLNWSSGRF